MLCIPGSLIGVLTNDNDTNYSEGYSKGFAEGKAGSLENVNIETIYHTHKYVSTDGTLKETSIDDYTEISDFNSDQTIVSGSCWGLITEEKTCNWYQVTRGDTIYWNCSGCRQDEAPFQRLDEIHSSCGGTRTGIGSRNGRVCLNPTHSQNRPSGTHTYTETYMKKFCGKTHESVESYTLHVE